MNSGEKNKFIAMYQLNNDNNTKLETSLLYPPKMFNMNQQLKIKSYISLPGFKPRAIHFLICLFFFYFKFFHYIFNSIFQFRWRNNKKRTTIPLIYIYIYRERERERVKIPWG
jgi:hypothetical protein